MTVPLNNYSEVTLSLWAAALALLAVLFILYLRKFSRSESKRTYFWGLAIFCLVFLVFRILTIYYNFFLEGGLIGSQVQDLDALALFFWGFNFCVGSVGIIFLIFAVEKEVFTKSKYLLTIFQISLTLLFILFAFINLDIAIIIQWISPVPLIIVPLLYLYIGIKSVGEPRIYSLKMFGGILLIALSHGIFSVLSPNWESFDSTLLLFLLSPILMICALILIISSEFKR